MTPTGSGQAEFLRNAVLNVQLVHYEGATIEMCLAEGSSYLQLLTDGEAALRTDNLQSAESSASSALHWLEVEDVTEVHLQLFSNKTLQLFLRIFHMPTIEVSSLLIVVVEHLGKYGLVRSVAERLRRRAYPAFRLCLNGKVRQRWLSLSVSHRHKIRLANVLPTVLEFLRCTAAALAEACVAYLVATHQYLSACGKHSLRHLRTRGLGDALITLTMVVGADIEDGVVLTVIPLHQLVVLADEREEAVLSGAGLMFASLFYLR